MTSEKNAELPAFNSQNMSCLICQKAMFYSEENLVHVCLSEDHGVLCYFEPDKCWFAAKEETAAEIGRRGIKYHFIPSSVFEKANLTEFVCDQEPDRIS